VARRYYVDTSAYLAVLLGEASSAELARELAGGQLLTSALLALEAHRTLVRLSREGTLAASDLQAALARMDADLAMFAVRDLTLDLCRARVMPVVTTPRSLDLAHLTTARWFHQQEPLSRFVSLDARQSLAASELGLPV
jgi:PIN domain nuclease of toxin-antitoxin system